ncbi:MAG: DUF6318 family protein, partial [Actinomycetota bacterium]|nr:DUF6318 family protein [Actinomycetota bacterium]
MLTFSERSRKVRVAAMLAGIAFTFVLTGCAGSPKATPTTTGTAPPAASASAAASPAISPTASAAVYKPADASGPAQNVPLPVKPPLADEFSKAGIEAFARYWYETLSYAYETANFGPLEAITDPGCVSCANVKAGHTPWHQDGRWTAGGRMVVISLGSAFTVTKENNYQVILSVKQEAITY